jgi:hypothetical protein
MSSTIPSTSGQNIADWFHAVERLATSGFIPISELQAEDR